jgi:hypothetical protein
MIWPELDEWSDGTGAAGPQKPKDLAGTGAINLLTYLREVVLQDSAFLIDSYPGSPVWTHPVFQHPDYRPYQQKVLAQAAPAAVPDRLTLLAQALPEFTEHLTTAEARHTAQLSEITASLTAVINGLEARLTNSYVGHLRHALAEATLRIDLPEALAPATATATATATMTIPDLDPAGPALDDRWGSRWRAGRTAEVQWYSLRLEVIREIRRVSRSRRIAEISAMHTVAADHQRSGGSLDLFCKRLRRDRKERDTV